MIERYREIKRQKAAGEREEGFTLIELLIVIVVLGILAAVVVFALGSVTGQSAKAACASDAKTVETAVASFQAENPAGTISQANLLSTANGGPFLRSWPANNSHYYIQLNMATGSTASEVDVYPVSGTPTTLVTTLQPAAGTGWVNFDTEGSAAGCNAVN